MARQPPCLIAIITTAPKPYSAPYQMPRQRVREMAERAVPGLYAGFSEAIAAGPATVGDRTVIASPAARKMTVAQAERIFDNCLA